jgi:hypothetical protein
MPRSKSRELGLFGQIVALGALTILLASPGFLWWPLALVGPVVFIGSGLFSSNRAQEIAKEREGESICQFARGFDCRTVDTWIIRAVYEQYSGRFPLRPSDRLEEDLGIDGEDLLFDARDIAQRTGRSLDECESNPMFGNVKTLRDMVMFFHHQPLLSAPQVRQQR